MCLLLVSPALQTAVENYVKGTPFSRPAVRWNVREATVWIEVPRVSGKWRLVKLNHLLQRTSRSLNTKVTHCRQLLHALRTPASSEDRVVTQQKWVL